MGRWEKCGLAQRHPDKFPRLARRFHSRRSARSLSVCALTGSSPRERPERRCLDGKGEAQLIHLACSKAPDGRQRWTLELLARLYPVQQLASQPPERGVTCGTLT